MGFGSFGPCGRSSGAHVACGCSGVPMPHGGETTTTDAMSMPSLRARAAKLDRESTRRIPRRFGPTRFVSRSHSEASHSCAGNASQVEPLPTLRCAAHRPHIPAAATRPDQERGTSLMPSLSSLVPVQLEMNRPDVRIEWVALIDLQQ